MSTDPFEHDRARLAAEYLRGTFRCAVPDDDDIVSADVESRLAAMRFLRRYFNGVTATDEREAYESGFDAGHFAGRGDALTAAEHAIEGLREHTGGDYRNALTDALSKLDDLIAAGADAEGGNA